MEIGNDITTNPQTRVKIEKLGLYIDPGGIESGTSEMATLWNPVCKPLDPEGRQICWNNRWI